MLLLKFTSSEFELLLHGSEKFESDYPCSLYQRLPFHPKNAGAFPLDKRLPSQIILYTRTCFSGSVLLAQKRRVFRGNSGDLQL